MKKYILIALAVFWGLETSRMMSVSLFNGNGAYRSDVKLDHMYEKKVSLHFLLPTIGRRKIFKLLESLKNQVQRQDYVTIVFDGKDIDHVFDKVKAYTRKFHCHVNLIYQEVNRGFWGHPIRNTYRDLPGDFIMHCDDDNVYLDGSISAIRKICTDTSKVYLFKIYVDKQKSFIWKVPNVQQMHVDTGCGVIPTKLNIRSIWSLHYGGDNAFYKKLAKRVGQQNVIFVDHIIYSWRP